MDRRFLVVLGLSLVFALVVSSIFYFQFTARGQAKSGPTNTRDVVVATKALAVGMTVKPADVHLQKMPVEQFPKGAFSKVEEVIDRPVVSNILMDEPVLGGDHPLLRLPNALCTPHTAWLERNTYELYFGEAEYAQGCQGGLADSSDPFVQRHHLALPAQRRQ